MTSTDNTTNALASPDVIENNSAVIKRWYDEDAPRNAFFNQLLSHLAPSQLNILQVGAIEEISLAWRLWSGWSDVHFGHYIKQYGGSLIILDINEEHLRNSAFLSELYGYRDSTTFLCGRAEEVFMSGESALPLAHVVYLDGANDPKETSLQLQYVRTDRAIVIIDDWEIKGQEIDTDQWPFQLMHISQDLTMGLLDVRKQYDYTTYM